MYIFGFKIFLLIFLIYKSYINVPYDCEYILLNSNLKRFKTGDIILYNGYNNSLPIILCNHISHMGIIIKYKDKIMVLELINHFYPWFKGIRKQTGDVVLIDLKKRILNFKGYCYYKELNKPVQKSDYSIMKYVKSLIKRIKYSKNFVNDIFCRIVLNEPPQKNQLFCIDLFFIILDFLNIVDFESYNWDLSHIYNVLNLKTKNEFKYKKLKLIKYYIY